MIFIHARSMGEVIECGTPQEAVALITERRLLPAGLRIWWADAPLVEIAFEDLQQMAGHDPLDVDTARWQIDHLMQMLCGMLKNKGLFLDVYDHMEIEVSTSGIPSGHQAVKKVYGNPCVRIRVRVSSYLRAEDGPRSIGPTELTELVARAGNNLTITGWAMLHGSCSVVMRIPNSRPFREIEMFLSRPRAMFDKEEADEQ
jgi:hypothetical protein